MQLDVTKLTASVAKMKTVQGSVIKLMTDLSANQKDLAKQLADAIAAEDPAAIQAVQTAMDSGAQDISDEADAFGQAVVDNTPAAKL